MHRPDLPFAVLQDTAINWSSHRIGRLADARALDASPIYLFPFGPGGGTKAGVRVVAHNGSARHLGDAVPVAGVGIYRSGLQRGVPAFYLWGSVSRLRD